MLSYFKNVCEKRHAANQVFPTGFKIGYFYLVGLA